MSDRIDVHQHFLPDFYRQALHEAGIVHPDGMAAVPQWSVDEALATMDALGVELSCVSVSSPGVTYADAATARSMARRLNEAAADLVKAHRDRFRFFAITPLPDVEGALAEIDHAFALGASGVVFETNFDGMYLGDERLEPVYDELNRRDAVLFLHPTSPHCPCGGSHGATQPDLTLGYPTPMLEFMFETTRTVTNMLLSGALERHPNIRVIVPHAGACLPVLAGRIQLLKDAGPHPVPHAPADLRAALAKLHFDLAGAPVPEALSVLLQIADPAHIHYGSDWPFTPLAGCKPLLSALLGTPLLDHVLRDDVLGGNARRLLQLGE